MQKQSAVVREIYASQATDACALRSSRKTWVRTIPMDALTPRNMPELHYVRTSNRAALIWLLIFCDRRILTLITLCLDCLAQYSNNGLVNGDQPTWTQSSVIR